MRIALVSTVKDEEKSILQHLAYHRHLGITDVFIFLDHSTDRTREMVAALPYVTLFDNLTYQDLLPYNLHKPELDLDKVRRYFSTHFGLRQVFNANMALALCREAGIDWLLHLDQDELVCLDQTKVEQGALRAFLAGLAPTVGAVSFQNLEYLPTTLETERVFEGAMFKNRDVDPGQHGWPKAQIYNPFTHQMDPAGWFWGHNSGKLVLRTGGQAYVITPHRCHAEGELLEAESLLHYNISSFQQFVKKYRNFYGYPRRPRVRPLRMLLVEVVNHAGFSEQDLLDFYRQHVMFSAEEVAHIQQLNPDAILEIPAVADFFYG